MTYHLSALLPAVPYTLIVAGAAYAIGASLGVPLALMRRSSHLAVRAGARALTDLIRSVPPITWLFLIYFALPSVGVVLPPLPAAIVGLGMIATAYLSEVYRAGILAVPRGQQNAANALGFSRFDAFTRVIAPQAVRVVIPPAATFGIGLLKESALASTIGVAELTFRAADQSTRYGHGLQLFIEAGVIYMLLSLPLAYVSRGIDRRLRARYTLV